MACGHEIIPLLSEKKDKLETQLILENDYKQESIIDQETPNIIIWACGAADGFGDIEHFIDIANPKTVGEISELDNYKHVRLLMCHEELVPMACHKLKNANMHDTIIFAFKKENVGSVSGRVGKYFSEKINTSKVTLVFNISTPTFGIILRNFVKLPLSIPIINIAEQGASAFVGKVNEPLFQSLASWKIWAMGFAQNQFNVILKPQEKVSPIEAILKIEDRKFLKYLFHYFCKNRSLEFDTNQKLIGDFLQHSLLIPSYCQTGEQAFTAVAQGMICSDIIRSSNFKEVIFFVNEGNVNLGYFNPHFLQKYNIGSLELLSFNHSENQSSLIKSAKMEINKQGIKVRFIQGYFLNDVNYNSFLTASQLFRLCSGDKSLERGLSSHNMTLYLAKNYKTDVLLGLRHLLCFLDPNYHYPIFDALKQTQIIFDANDLLEISDSIRNSLTKEFYEHWHKTIAELTAKHNFFSYWPKIVEHSLCYATLCRYEQDRKESSEKTKMKEALREKLKNLEKQLYSDKDKQFEIYFNNLMTSSPESLDLSYDFFTDKQFVALMSILPKLNSLKVLRISSSSATLKRNYVNFIESIRSHSSLQVIFLDDNHLLDEEIVSLISAFHSIPNLININLNSNHITNVKPIIGLLEVHPYLRHVSLVKNPIEDAQLKLMHEVKLPVKKQSQCSFGPKTKAILGIFDSAVDSVRIDQQNADFDKKKIFDSKFILTMSKNQLKAVDPLILSFPKVKKREDSRLKKCGNFAWYYLIQAKNAFYTCCKKTQSKNKIS